MSSDAHELPRDVDALHALILAERAELASSRAALATSNAELAARRIEIEHLKMVLAKLRRQRYGRSSEKLDAEINQLEMWVDDAEVGLAAAEAKAKAEGEPSQQQASKPPKKPAVRKPLP